MEMNPETDQIMSPAMRSGIGSIATGDMVPEQMAGGGIVAFQAGGKSGIDAIKTASESRQSYRDQLEREVLESMKRLKTEDPFKESRAQDETIRKQIAESKTGKGQHQEQTDRHRIKLPALTEDIAGIRLQQSRDTQDHKIKQGQLNESDKKGFLP
jgi:hypothetical protein